MRRRLLDHTYKKTVTGNPAVARSVARMYPDISFPGFTTQDGTPSPENPVDIVNAQSPVQVEVMGGNLFDVGLMEDLPESGNLKVYQINMGRSGWYICSSNIPIAGGVANIFFVAGKASTGSASSSVNGVSNKKSVSVNSLDGWVTVIARSKGDNPNDPRNFDIAINVGETALPYEPYKQPQTVTITSDRPITQWDKLIKQDGVWGWLYKSNEVEFDGSDGINGNYYPTLIINKIIETGADRDTIICNYCPSEKISFSNSANNSIQIRETDTYWNFLSGEEFKAWLKQKNDGGIPFKILYETENTEFVPLSQEEQSMLNTLHTNNPTTIVQNSIGTDVTLTYKTKRSLEVTQ